MCQFCGGHNTTCPACSPRQQTHREKKIELAPIQSKFEGGAVFKGSGNSHFTVDKSGIHVTTEIPNLKLKMDYTVKDRFDL